MEMKAQYEISRELEPGESLLWAGKPKQGILLQASDAFLIPFSLVWCGFAIFWEWSVLRSPGTTIMALAGIPFVVIGLFFVFGRFVWDARRRAKTYYGLTDRRVVILSRSPSRTTSSLSLKTLQEISIAERADRSGTIVFGQQHPMAKMYGGASWPGMGRYVAPSFEAIQDAKRVHHQILEAQRAAT